MDRQLSQIRIALQSFGHLHFNQPQEELLGGRSKKIGGSTINPIPLLPHRPVSLSTLQEVT